MLFVLDLCFVSSNFQDIIVKFRGSVNATPNRHDKVDIGPRLLRLGTEIAEPIGLPFTVIFRYFVSDHHVPYPIGKIFAPFQAQIYAKCEWVHRSH